MIDAESNIVQIIKNTMPPRKKQKKGKGNGGAAAAAEEEVEPVPSCLGVGTYTAQGNRDYQEDR